MPLSLTDSIAVTALLERKSLLELELTIFRGISAGRTGKLFLAFGLSYVDVISRLPAEITSRMTVIVERPEPLMPMQTCESTLAEIYLPTLPTEAELKEIGGRLLGLLRKPEPSRISRLISECG
jgi:hypothetical protein